MMSTYYASVARPALIYPEHRMSLDDMLAMARRIYGDVPHYRAIERMIRNTAIDERRFAVPLDELGTQTGLSQRSALYMEHARPLGVNAVTPWPAPSARRPVAPETLA